jgi:hypothetical protein
MAQFTDGSSSGSAFSDGSQYTTNLSAQVNITDFGLQKGTDRTVYIKWNWNQLHTKEFRVVWYYYTGQGTSFVGSDARITSKESTYTAPSNATGVRVKIQPIADSRNISNNYTAAYWTAKWSTIKQYYFKNNPPTVPGTPTVSISDKYKLTASLANVNSDTEQIEWYVVKNDKTKFYSVKTKVNKNAASMVCTIEAGGEYKVKCRAWRGTSYSNWSEYSSNEGTIPATVGEITRLEAFSDTGVRIDWNGVKNCTSYEIEYTTRQDYFDSNPNEVKNQTVPSSICHAEVSGLDLGETYFFRVRAVNDKGNSPWSTIKSIILGKDPTAPTTWSSTATAVVGEELILYWVHNATDGSSEKQAELELDINGSVTTEVIVNTDTGDDKDETKSKKIDTSKWSEGTTLKWRVRTMGITGNYGLWSVQRAVNIYAPATLQLNIVSADGDDISTLTSFPFYIKGVGGPSSQKVLGYHVSVIALEGYDSIDETGTGEVIAKGQEIFSKYYDIGTELMLELSAGNIDLENNISYRVICSVAMDSGLTTERSEDFTVAWADMTYALNAEVAYSRDTYSFLIRPYCLDENNNLVDDVTLGVYRRQFDGELIEIATDLQNSDNCFVTDPHPALDYGRYRIVAKTKATGAISYYDLPGFPIGESGIIIQWAEQWQNYVTSEINDGDTSAERPWSGSMVKLPYNVDTTDDNDPDVSLVEYIGRKHQVSYYGTQVGQTATWKTDIPKSDVETLYALRRLAIYQGDVYVRESSGSGYWAHVTVSISKTHQNRIVPVSLKVTRVEGGI